MRRKKGRGGRKEEELKRTRRKEERGGRNDGEEERMRRKKEGKGEWTRRKKEREKE